MPRCRTRRTSSTIFVGRDVRQLPEWEPLAAGGGRTIAQCLRSGAWRCPSVESGIPPRCRQLTGMNTGLAVFNFPRIFDKPALRRARGARTIAVVHSAVARTHEQTRLREPANGTSQVHAVDRKNLKLIASDVPHPASRVRRLAISRRHIWVPKGREPRLAFGKIANGSQWHPGEIGIRAPPRNCGE